MRHVASRNPLRYFAASLGLSANTDVVCSRVPSVCLVKDSQNRFALTVVLPIHGPWLVRAQETERLRTLLDQALVDLAG